MKWIACSERMPADCATIIFATSEPTVEVGQRAEQFGHWYTAEGYWDDEHVTHWMPMPELPE